MLTRRSLFRRAGEAIAYVTGWLYMTSGAKPKKEKAAELPQYKSFISNKIYVPPFEVTDKDIVDCLVYANYQFNQWLNCGFDKRHEMPVLYMSQRFYDNMCLLYISRWPNRAISDSHVMECRHEGNLWGLQQVFNLDIEIVPDGVIDWGDGPEYSCFLTCISCEGTAQSRNMKYKKID